jgi:hypothetical protein
VGVKSGCLTIRERLDNVVRNQRVLLVPVRGKANTPHYLEVFNRSGLVSGFVQVFQGACQPVDGDTAMRAALEED